MRTLEEAFSKYSLSNTTLAPALLCLGCPPVPFLELPSRHSPHVHPIDPPCPPIHLADSPCHPIQPADLPALLYTLQTLFNLLLSLPILLYYLWLLELLP
jgi:hypothetical protein